MESLGLIAMVLIAVTAMVLQKTKARKKFHRSVEYYEEARRQAILAGDDPSEIPTVEAFLAARGELHLLSEIGWERSSSDQRTSLPSSAELRISASLSEESYVRDNDDGYAAFVDETWAIGGVALTGITLERLTSSGLVSCELHSLVTGANDALYLNLNEDGKRKTYAADSRHVWHRNGDRIDNSAFVGIQNGAVPELALQPEAYATSFEQAATPAFDRVQTSDRKYIIRCLTSRGVSHRVVSKVVRYSDDRFSARCHFRWGERRTFLNTDLLAVFDMQAQTDIPPDVFLKKR